MNSPLLRRYPYTVLTLPLAAVVLVLAVVWDLNVFNLPGASIIRFEQAEFGEISMAFLLLVPAILADRRRLARQRRQEAELQAEQLRLLRVTLQTVSNVNNSLTELQLLRLHADGLVPQATLDQFDKTIQEIATQLRSLGNLEVFAERPTKSGLEIGESTHSQRR